MNSFNDHHRKIASAPSFAPSWFKIVSRLSFITLLSISLIASSWGQGTCSAPGTGPGGVSGGPGSGSGPGSGPGGSGSGGGGGVQDVPFQGGYASTFYQTKCVYQEFTNVDPCEVKYYLKLTTHTLDNESTITSNYYPSGATTELGCGEIDYGTGSTVYTYAKTYDATSILVNDTNCTPISTNYSGSETWSDSWFDNRPGHHISGSCGDPCDVENITWDSLSTGDTVSGTLSSNGWAFTNVIPICYSNRVVIEDACVPDEPPACGSTTITYTNIPSVEEVSGTVTFLSQTVKTVTDYEPTVAISNSTTYTLANEYTTCDLIGKAKNDLGTGFLGADPLWGNYVLGSLIEYRSQIAELDRAVFTYTYPTQPHSTYLLTKYFTTVSAGCAIGDRIDVVTTPVSEIVTGDGLYHTETNSLEPICINNLIGYQLVGPGGGTEFGGVAELTMVIVTRITIQPLTVACISGQCGGSTPGVAGAQLSLGSAIANFGLGHSQYGQAVGELQLLTAAPGLTLATPQALTLLAASNLVTTITNTTNGMLRQVGASQCLVDIVPTNQYKYQMVFYATNALLPGHDSVTPISTNGLTPIVIWVVSNPDTSSASNRLQVVEVHGSQQITNLYTYNSSNEWQLDEGNGLTRMLMTETWDPTYTSNHVETLKTINPANGALVSQTASYYQMFTFGQRLTKEIIGTGTATLTNLYFYDTNLSDGSRGLLTEMDRGDGTWVQYTYDTSNRVSTVIMPYGDYASTAETRSITYYYDAWTDYGDDPTCYPSVPRNVIDSTGARSFFIATSNMTINIVCTGPSTEEPFDYPSQQLCTTNWYYPSGDPNAAQLKQVDHPDGTLDLYTYGTNSLHHTNVVFSGQANTGRTAVVDGTETISLYGPVGELQFRQMLDVASGIITSQETYTNFDFVARPQLVAYLDGTSVTNTYDCCNLESVVGRDGMSTSYTYDDLKRRTTETRYVAGSLGITSGYFYDAAGRTLVTTLTGTNGSSVITNSSLSYDTAGRTVYETNALGGVTTNTYGFDSSGRAVTTNAYPDGGVRIAITSADGNIYKTLGTAVHGVQNDSGIGYYGTYTKETKLNPDGSTTTEVVTNYTDLVGRQVRRIYSDGSYETTSYNDFGQVQQDQDADFVTTLYAYNARGEQDTVAQHLDATDGIQWAGTDRITKTIRDVVLDSGVGMCVERTRTYVWSTPGTDSSNLVSTVEVSTNGLNRWQITWNGGVGITNRSVTAYATGGYRYETNFNADGSYTYSAYQYGRLLTNALMTAGAGAVTQTTYSYDLFNRQSSVTDLRNGATTFAYNNAGMVTNTTSPSPGGGGSAQTTLTYYNKMMQVTNVVNPDGNSVSTSYYLTGDIHEQWGSRIYPVGYGYDYAGRQAKMTNWSSYATRSGARVTTWNFDAYRGWLNSKTYDDGKGPAYQYTAAGRLQYRWWARGTNTTYAYDGAGGLTNVTYNDGVTPGVGYIYNRLGRQTSVTQTYPDSSTVLCAYVYNGAGLKLSEAYTGGPLDGVSITNGYDNLLRRTNVVTLKSGVLTSTKYGYDVLSRLSTVSDGTNSATYGYLTNSMLVSNIVFQQGGTNRMTTTKTYDNLNRLTSISSANASNVVLDSHGYSYNLANQRTSVTNADGTYWVYSYDSLGQVTSGLKYWSDGSVVAGQQFGYGFDDIGNRKTTSAGGDQWGANLRYASYSANDLNQYTMRTVPGAIDVIGSATNTATVTVNDLPSYRKGSYYRTQLPINNASGAVWQSVTNMALLNEGTTDVRQIAVTNNAFLPQTPEHFYYDLDGNLTNDGRWTYTWDAENRLIDMTSMSSSPAASKQELDFVYDSQGQRLQKTVSAWNGSAYVAQLTNRFAYDDWNVVAILNPGFAVTGSFMLGSDLNGSIQGVGGAGGLLKFTTGGTNCFVAYDGNGNVSVLVNAANAVVSATYEYGPFGEVIRATGPMAKANPSRFSTKYQDDETDLLYYGERYLNTSTGRWLSRDPAEEDEGGVNLYGFVGNNPACQTDDLGLAFYAIDGTWAKAGMRANPWQLYNNTAENPKRYWRGPWDLGGHDSYFSAFAVKNQICSDYCAASGVDFKINLTGWSRGAVIAVEVAELLNDLGCDCGCGKVKPVPVNWIGLFDAVAMTPGFWPTHVPPHVGHLYHAVKTSHKQFYFPTHHFQGETAKKIYNTKAPHKTSHSDVGMSVAKGKINDAYDWIESSAIGSGVKF